MIARRAVVCLGLSQLICWGVSFYLIGVFGAWIEADLGWSRLLVHGGFSAALVAMGVASPLVGRAIDRLGGGPVMAAGSVCAAVGCAGIAAAETIGLYYAAWIALGLAMRATLYDAAFAALARIGGPDARRAMAQVTLLGGLAATVFWPIGHALAEGWGWRAALLVYAGAALATVPLHLAIGRGDHRADTPACWKEPASAPLRLRRRRVMAALLYAALVALVNGLNSGLSAHMIDVLSELGLAAGLAVTVAALRGIGQSAARLAQVLFGGRLEPATLNLLAASVLPVCFTIGLASGASVAAAAVFAFFYGAGNGILSITRGTLPLVFFDARSYGAIVGVLLVPSFFVSAAAPLAFAAVISAFGAAATVVLAIAMSALILAAALGLKALAGRPA